MSKEEIPDAKHTFTVISAAVFTCLFNPWLYRHIAAAFLELLVAVFDLARSIMRVVGHLLALVAFPISIPLLFLVARRLQKRTAVAKKEMRARIHTNIVG
jgi:hypothetical protein